MVSLKRRIPRHLKRLPQNRYREKRKKAASLKNARFLRDAAPLADDGAGRVPVYVSLGARHLTVQSRLYVYVSGLSR